MSKHRAEKHEKQKREREAHTQEVTERETAASERHLVESPKGTSRLRFMFNLGLVIFLLLIFSITGPMMSALTGDGAAGDDVYATWKLPDGEVRSVATRDFIMEKRNLEWLKDFYRFLLLPAETKPEDDENVARFLIVEDLARLAGVSVSESELATFLTEFQAQIGGPAGYDMYVARRGRDVNKSMFEAMLRRGLVYRRYRSLLTSAVARVDPAEVVVEWMAQNQEHDFEYVALEASDFLEEAKGEVPDDEALQDWFDALNDYQKREFYGEAQWGADLACYAVDSETAPQALLDRYPPAEGTDPEVRAGDYYLINKSVRFLRPVEEEPADEKGGADETEESEDEPADESADESDASVEEETADEETADEETTDEETTDEETTDEETTDEETTDEETTDEEVAVEQPATDDRFYSFEEVADAARREAAVFDALSAWLADLKDRVGKEEVVDIETEAIAMGLSFEHVGPLPASEWLEGDQVWSGGKLTQATGSAEVGGLSRNVVVEKGGFTIARITERVDPSLPPFEEIRDRVVDKWATERSAKIALERLEAIRDSFVEKEETEEPADESSAETAEAAPEAGEEVEKQSPVIVDLGAFEAAATAAGFEVVERGFRPRYPGFGYDYAGEAAADRYVRSTSALYDLEVGELAEAENSRDLKHAFLVRYAGKRDPSLDRMGPYELTTQGDRMGYEAATEYFSESLDDPAWIERTFLLTFNRPVDEEEPEDRPASEPTE